MQQSIVDKLGQRNVLVEVRLHVEIECGDCVALGLLLLLVLLEPCEVSFVGLLQFGLEVLFVGVLAAGLFLAVLDALLLDDGLLQHRPTQLLQHPILPLVTAGKCWQAVLPVLFLGSESEVAVVLAQFVPALAVDIASECPALALLAFLAVAMG